MLPFKFYPAVQWAAAAPEGLLLVFFFTGLSGSDQTVSLPSASAGLHYPNSYPFRRLASMFDKTQTISLPAYSSSPPGNAANKGLLVLLVYAPPWIMIIMLPWPSLLNSNTTEVG